MKMVDKIICIKEVNENIRRCQIGMPLTRSLKELNCNCEFRKKFEEMDMIIHETSHEEEYKERERKRRSRPEVMERTRKRMKIYRKKRYWEDEEFRKRCLEASRKQGEKKNLEK